MRPNEQVGPICVLVGARLDVVSVPSVGQPWLPLASTAPAVLRCMSAAGGNGTITGRCQALSPGRAVISTTTKPRPDATEDRWSLTVDVLP